MRKEGIRVGSCESLVGSVDVGVPKNTSDDVADPFLGQGVHVSLIGHEVERVKELGQEVSKAQRGSIALGGDFQAIALGATAGTFITAFQITYIYSLRSSYPIMSVGIGRPFLYSYSAYGPEGIDKALKILYVCLSVSYLCLWILTNCRMNSR